MPLTPCCSVNSILFRTLPASAELGAGGDGVVKDHKVQLLLAVYLAHGGEQHTVGLKTHHLARRQVQYGDDGLADELLRFIELADTGEDLAGSAAAVVEGELQKLIGLLDGLAERTLHMRMSHLAKSSIVTSGSTGGAFGSSFLPSAFSSSSRALGHVDAREERLALADLRACRERAVDRGAVPAAAGLVRADLREGLIAAFGHEGAEKDQRDAQRLEQVIHDRGKASLLLSRPSRAPRGSLINVLVRALDELEDLLKREMQLELVHLRGVLIAHGLYHTDKLVIHRVGFALRGTLPPKYFSTMAVVRLTRLPRSFARSVLMVLMSSSLEKLPSEPKGKVRSRKKRSASTPNISAST